MIFRNSENTRITPAFRVQIAMVCALFSSAAALLISGNIIKQINTSASVEFNPSAWNWISESQWKIRPSFEFEPESKAAYEKIEPVRFTKHTAVARVKVPKPVPQKVLLQAPKAVEPKILSEAEKLQLIQNFFSARFVSVVKHKDDTSIQVSALSQKLQSVPAPVVDSKEILVAKKALNIQKRTLAAVLVQPEPKVLASSIRFPKIKDHSAEDSLVKPKISDETVTASAAAVTPSIRSERKVEPTILAMNTQSAPQQTFSPPTTKTAPIEKTDVLHLPITQIISTAPTKHMSSQTRVTIQAAPRGIPPVVQPKDIVPAEPPVEPTILDTPIVITQAAPVPAYKAAAIQPAALASSYVEAFDWSTAVANAKSENLGGDWKISRAPGHVALISRGASSTYPMISSNNSRLLGGMAGTSIQAHAGIIFGKIPAGWNVEFSGRSERAVLLDSKNQLAPHPDTERYFAFLNASPGAQLVYLNSANSRDSTAIAVLVMEGASTYLDLSDLHKISLHGRVLDGSAGSAKGLKDVTVRIIGQSDETVTTGARGKFEMNSVWTATGQPLYFETESATGYTHRYEISEKRLNQSVDLFRLSADQIQSWISQLEGGISPDSGLVVGAVPDVAGQSGDQHVFANVTSLTSDATLSPETYVLNSEGELHEKTPLDTDHSRFVAIQVPEGAALAEIETSAHQRIWSKILVTSPGVVNLIGP